MIVPMPEEHDLSAPIKRNVHTVEECDRMLRLPLAPDVADAWLDERDLAAMARESEQPFPAAPNTVLPDVRRDVRGVVVDGDVLPGDREERR